MNKSTERYIAAAKHGISFYVIKNKNTEDPRAFGIFAQMNEDENDCKSVENLFFTQTEAEEYCKWLADNEVYPVSLCDVLGNI